MSFISWRPDAGAAPSQPSPAQYSFILCSLQTLHGKSHQYLLILSGLHGQALEHVLKCYGKNYDTKGVRFFTLVFEKKKYKATLSGT